jgi:hypothetical protein
MDVNDISVFLNCIKPNIEDIDNVKNYLDQSNQEYEELNELIRYVGDDYKRVTTYHNQDMIYKYLDMISISRTTYDAIKYLISSDNSNIYELPQYIKASKNLNTIWGYLNDRKSDISERVDVLSYAYMDKYISKKYYDMFSSGDIYVIDPMEFSNLIKRLEIEDSTKIEILKSTITSNINHYYKKVDNDLKKDILKTYSHYLTNKFISMIDNASKYIDLSLHIEKLLELKQNNYTNDSLITLKRIWLINEIDNNEDIEVIKKLIDELNALVRYEE